VTSEYSTAEDAAKGMIYFNCPENASFRDSYETTLQDLQGQIRRRRTAPNTENGTAPPKRVENAKRRPREYLTVKEVTKLIDGARTGARSVRTPPLVSQIEIEHPYGSGVHSSGWLDG